jgi:hypothetical protein
METERLERGLRQCDCGNEFRQRNGEEDCDDCYDRTHPRCECCGKVATCVVDIFVGGLHIERAPTCSYECARGAVDEAHTPVIDTVVPVEAMGRVIAVERPCWCGLRERTVCRWCPEHGELS